MKLAVETCDPGPGRFVAILAVPRMRSLSIATTVRPGGGSIQMSCACASVINGS